MQLARILTPDGPVSGEHVDGHLHTEDGVYEIGADGRWLPPCEPSTIYCVGQNYAETAEERQPGSEGEPDFFIKPPTSLLAHGRPIGYPAFTDELTCAGELAAVIDERCRDLALADVPDVVRGYTVLNDVDAFDQPSLTARKAFDGSAPLGPWLETDVDPTSVDFHTEVDGARRVEGNTGQMRFDVYEVVSFLARRLTLRAGDVVAFGSPGDPDPIDPLATIEVTYDGIGTLRNPVVGPDR